MSRIWAGIDSGKGHHHGLALDAEGNTRLSRRVVNDEPELLQLIGDVLGMAAGDEVTWAIDMTGGEPALLLALLIVHGQKVLYIPGRLVNRASDGYRGEGKTDARDAYVIADQARMRRDLRPINFGDETALELKLLTGRRTDLVEDRTRTVNRLRGSLLSLFPALERDLDITYVGPLKLLTGYQTPAAIRRTGITRLAKWLANRKVKNSRSLAERAVEAAKRQQTSVPAEKTIAQLVRTPGRGGDCPQRTDRRDRRAHRGAVPKPRTGRHCPEPPRNRGRARGGISGRCRRQPERLRFPGRIGRLRRGCSRATRFRQGQRQPAPPQPVPPPTPTGLLYLRVGQHPL